MKVRRVLASGFVMAGLSMGMLVGTASPASAGCDLNVTSDSGPSCTITTPALNVGAGPGRPCIFIGQATITIPGGATTDPSTGVYVDCNDRH